MSSLNAPYFCLTVSDALACLHSEFGAPVRQVQRARLSGIVSEISQSYVCIDDGTATIDLPREDVAKGEGSTTTPPASSHHDPAAGDFVDCFCARIDGGSWKCSWFVTSTDPNVETVRWLDQVRLYRDVYFSGVYSTEDDDEDMQTTMSMEAKLAATSADPASPYHVQQQQQQQQIQHHHQQQHYHAARQPVDADGDQDDDFVFSQALSQSQEPMTGLATELEQVFRQQQAALSLQDLMSHSSAGDRSSISQALQSLAMRGIVYEMDGKWQLL